MRNGKWRLYRPKQKPLTDIDPVEASEAVKDSLLYRQARKIVDQTMESSKKFGKRYESAFTRTARAIKILQQKEPLDSASLLALVILQTPGAVKAQRQMDKRFGGYMNRQARVLELIDFNDSFVELVLSLDTSELAGFDERLKQEMAEFCRQLQVSMFKNSEIDAIIHGLSREIAVYLGARSEGFLAELTSRTEDAMGVDMIITDPASRKSIGIDIKTRSAFHWRLARLAQRRAISESDWETCENSGFCRIHNQRKSTSSTVLFRIDTSDDHLGKIVDYRFANTSPLGQKITRALSEQGRYA